MVVLVASSAVAFAATNFNPSPAILGWWIVAALVAFARFVHIRYRNKTLVDPNFDGKQHIVWFATGSLISGSLLGFFPYLAFPGMDSIQRSMVVLILAGLAGGASTVLSSDRTLAWAYVGLLLIPPSVVAIFGTQYDMKVLGILGIFYWVILAMAIRRNARFIYRAAKLHHNNEELLEAIADEKQLVESSNTKLQQAYAEINKVNADLEQKIQDRTHALSIMASTDELTGLKNRHTFVRTLNANIDRANNKQEKFSILFVDLDGFKEINDIRGHLIGDKVLKEIAGRLQKSVKNKDYICRWGGDEFVLVIEESEPLLLDTISTRICQSVQEPINIHYDTIKITASIGIATYPTHGTTTTDLVNAADVAMYELKKDGKNGTMLFEAAFLEKIRFEQQILTDLSTAIEKQQFELFYQPMAPRNADMPIIFEGLIRWKPADAYIPPVIFVPIAETCDAIFDIGNWIIRKTCHDLSENSLGINSQVSINISVKQLLARGFVDFIQQNLEEFQVKPWRLQIEITESVFAKNLHEATLVLNRLRDLGITIALDDFGCGFSSLSYLQQLPIDIIKIDQSFVKQLDSGGEKIIEATVSIAEAFACKVVAEGIESELQHQRLSQLGVDYLQGFHIAKPCLPQDMESCWLIQENKRQSI